MALILKNKESSFRTWYQNNKQTLSEKRKKRYGEDPAYRQRALENSRRRRRGELTLTTPPDGLISFADAAKRIGVSDSALHEWRRKKYFPDPKNYAGRLWFAEKQVFLLLKLKEVIRVYGKRRGNVKWDRLKEVVASVGADWN